MTTETAVATEDMDFLGNGSLAEIMSKMGDIDKVLSEINEIDTSKPTATAATTSGSRNKNKTDKGNVGSGGNADSTKKSGFSDSPSTAATLESPVAATVAASYDESATSLFSDGDVYVDDGADILDLQGELKAAEESERQAKEERMKAAELKRQCIANRKTVYGTWVEGTTDEAGGGEKNIKKSITVAVNKPSKDSSVGISMKTSKGITRIVAISDDGLLAGSGLEEKQQLVEVNGVAIKNARHARQLIQTATEEVKMVALYIEGDH
jgi:hypothetical protein